MHGVEEHEESGCKALLRRSSQVRALLELVPQGQPFLLYQDSEPLQRPVVRVKAYLR